MVSQLPLLRAALIWLVIAVFAVVNGVVRENILIPALGVSVALPLSGISLSLIVIVVTYLSIDFFTMRTAFGYWLIGVQWVVMTVAFEFLFGHYVAGKSWSALLQSFDVTTGDLMSLVLLTSLVSPYLIARLKLHR